MKQSPRAPEADTRAETPLLPDVCITPAEWRWLAAWVILILCIVALPYWHGYHATPPGGQFAGFVGQYSEDYNSYLAWMRQARDGHILFKDMYTTEPHSRVLFHPLFWLMGTASRITGLSLMAVWYLVQGAACVFFMIAFYRFSAWFTDDAAARRLALVLGTTASGLGWLIPVSPGTPPEQKPIDLWMAEASGFRGMSTSFFTLPLALGLMLLAFNRSLQYVRTGRRAHAAGAGAYGLLLATIHQYDVVTLVVVLGAYALVAGRGRRLGFVLTAAILAPYCLYSLAVVFFDPVFAAHRRAMMGSPSVPAYMLGLGLPLICGVTALLAPAVRQQTRQVGFLAVWLVANLLIVAMPIGFQRKLIWGIQVPLCILSASLVVHVLRRIHRSADAPHPARRSLLPGAAAFALLSAIGSGVTLRAILTQQNQHSHNEFLPGGCTAALAWLDSHGTDETVVAATQSIAPLIPGRSGCTAFSGHWAQTIDPLEKDLFVASLFLGNHVTLPSGGPPWRDESDLLRILQRNRIRYIVLDADSRAKLGIPPNRENFAFAPFVRKAYTNDFATIWEMLDPPPAQHDWGNQNWRGIRPGVTPPPS